MSQGRKGKLELLGNKKGTLVMRRGGDVWNVPIKPALRTNNAQVLIRSILAGGCIGPVQALLVTQHLAKGDLVQVLPDYDMQATEAFIVYASARFMRPVVRSFIDFLVAQLAVCEGID